MHSPTHPAALQSPCVCRMPLRVSDLGYNFRANDQLCSQPCCQQGQRPASSQRCSLNRRQSMGPEPTMTITTAGAFALIGNMFQVRASAGQGLACLGSIVDAGWESCSACGGILAHQPSFHICPQNNSQKGGLALEHDFQPPTNAVTEPTMTLSGHAAFQAIQSMFVGTRRLQRRMN